ncbi:MAG: integrase [Candidatus Bathyarchaeota archaeon]|nr:integrase [Candidatus Bathyarchaeota archaeon]
MGSNPTGPAKNELLSAKTAFIGLLYELAFGTVLGRSQAWWEDGPMAGEQIDELKRRVEEQAKALGYLASSLEKEDVLGQLIKRVEKPCEALSSLAAGVAGGSFVLSWPETRSLFLQYLEFKRYEPKNAQNMLNYLNRFVKTPIAAPVDVMRIFSPLTAGQRHHLNRAMRAWFKCLEINRPNREFKEFLDSLRKAIPKDEMGIDINVPEEEQIVSDLRRLASDPIQFQAAYNLLLDSGLRLVEVVRLLNNFPEVERLEGFYRCPVGLFRGTKQAYYCYLTEYTHQLVKQLKGRVSQLSISKWLQNHEYTRAKYLRKFANDMMTSEKLNIPESVADFIQGRVPKSIGAKHYMQLKRKADQYYPRYAQYITELRQKAGIITA